MSQNPFSLKGKLALITGGGTGLGLAIAKAMTDAGAEVIITGRREEPLKEATATIGGKCHYAIHDVTQLTGAATLVTDLEDRYGPLDILVNNAGINMKKFALEVSDEEFSTIIQTNLQAVFTLTREVSKKMVTRKKGSIIMITSMAAVYGIPGVPAYTASKSAVLGLTRTLACDLSPHGIRINAIAPGFIETPMLTKAMQNDENRKNKVLSRTPMGTFGKPEDIGYAAVYLASDAAKFVNGTQLCVDGGNSIGF
ncbi:glucose 1-dehydrogenase [Rhodocytophaga aerolata]|uniref:Glucose 1-dehydrogenase n=1 Tax=Rhodocytophaga aerolata TaxID=455078 RepID=A0ABT8R562_9BACT|nr:glucose 1-dehydrogenase [Rhodocytophaga aerolata]MDO1445902.1 glucose 1-dehydrogenase [Rhodocytophaga aerolata]